MKWDLHHVHTHVRTHKSRKRAIKKGEKEREREIYIYIYIYNRKEATIERCVSGKRRQKRKREREREKKRSADVYKGIRNGEGSGAAATSKRPPTGRTSSGLSARVPAGACTCPWESRVDRANSMSRCAAPTPRCFDSGWTGVARCAPGRDERARARARVCVRA